MSSVRRPRGRLFQIRGLAAPKLLSCKSSVSSSPKYTVLACKLLYSLAPQYTFDDCQLVAATGRYQLQSRLRLSFLVALLVSAIRHFLSLNHVCATVFHSILADQVLLYRHSVKHEKHSCSTDQDFVTRGLSDSIIWVRYVNVPTYLLRLCDIVNINAPPRATSKHYYITELIVQLNLRPKRVGRLSWPKSLVYLYPDDNPRDQHSVKLLQKSCQWSYKH